MPSSDFNEKIGEATLNPKTKDILEIIFHQTHLRFRCLRCAIFCCRLGGPKLTQNDIERIRKEGYSVEDVVERLSSSEFENLPVACATLKNREDGSCVFLKFDEERSVHKCSIYEVRPALCRLYPFDFQKVGPYSFKLKLIPCCSGLNDPGGQLVDKEFVTNHLLSAILELMTECNLPANKTSFNQNISSPKRLLMDGICRNARRMKENEKVSNCRRAKRLTSRGTCDKYFTLAKSWSMCGRRKEGCVTNTSTRL